jgi:transketolase
MRETSMKMVHELARRDPRVVFIGSDLGAGALDAMRKEMPERFFMEGVTEAAIIGMAAGLAMDGYIPYVCTIATFLTRRCYEQVAVDLCLHNLPVRLIANGGGLVYAPLGPTHMAIEDIAIMRALPNMAVVAPADAEEMRRFMPTTLDWPGPIYIRLGKGGDKVVTKPEHGFQIGKAIELKPGGDVVALCTGVMASRALAAAELLAKDGIALAVVHLPTVKPLDEEAVLKAARQARLLVSVEEHSRVGGLGAAMIELLADRGIATPSLRLALPDEFPDDYGSQEHLLERAGLSPAAIAGRVRDALKSRH